MAIDTIPNTPVSRETYDRLATFLGLLRQWNAHASLVSARDEEVLVTRHLLDSINLAQIVNTSGTIADLGSGAGFPGLVVAIVLHREVTLIEANHRKAAFLREAARLTAAPVIVHAGRIEELSATFDVITARAVAPLAQLLRLVFGRVPPGGTCLFPKGRQYQSEIDLAAKAWSFHYTVHASQTDPAARILEITNLARRVSS